MKICIIGAGKTGRGFLGRLLLGEEVTFIDKDEALVRDLQSAGRFGITYFGNKRPSVTVGFAGIHTWETVKEIDADLIFVSVGGTNLADVGRELSARIKSGQRIIVCENASKPAKKLYDAIVSLGFNYPWLVEAGEEFVIASVWSETEGEIFYRFNIVEWTEEGQPVLENGIKVVPAFVTPEEKEEDLSIVKTKSFYFKPMTREEAVLQMNLLEHNFFAFRDEDNGGSFAVVYRRNDGGYGLIDDAK